MINIKGIMVIYYFVEVLYFVLITDYNMFTYYTFLKQIGNGWIDDESDTNGLIDFAWHHALVSNEAREDFKQNCHGTIYETSNCSKVIVNSILEMGNLNFLNIYAPVCQPLGVHPATGQSDLCDLLYVQNYLNLPSVQEALNANRSKLPYPWEPCRLIFNKFFLIILLIKNTT